jgi:hypothetical protein
VYAYKFTEKPNYNKLIHLLKSNLMDRNLVPSKTISWAIQDSQCSIEMLEEEKIAVKEQENIWRRASIYLTKDDFDFDNQLTDEYV